MFNRIVVGGTFNTMHRGHAKLLETAANIGDSLVIGLTTDEFATRFKPVKVPSFEKRRKRVEEFVKAFGKPYEVIGINDSYGIATIDPKIDCIVVSEETLLRAEEINIIRFKKNLPKLNIVVVPLVLADDGKPLSSERIHSEEIDKEGRIT